MVLSGHEAAAMLARRWGLRDVAPADLRELAKAGLIRVACPGRWPLYDLTGFTAVDELRRIGDARRQWLAASVDRWGAAAILGMCVHEFDALVARCGLPAGPFGRYRRSDVERMRRAQCRSGSRWTARPAGRDPHGELPRPSSLACRLPLHARP